MAALRDSRIASQLRRAATRCSAWFGNRAILCSAVATHFPTLGKWALFPNAEAAHFPNAAVCVDAYHRSPRSHLDDFSTLDHGFAADVSFFDKIPAA